MSSELNPRFSQGAAPEAAAGQSPLDPAAANMCPDWVDLCAKVGFTVVAVQVPYCPELWANSGFEKDLGHELTAVNLGHLDSVKYFDPITFFFYVGSHNLASALQLIKARLSTIGLLPRVKIGHMDLEANTWRTFYPELERAGS